MGSIWGAGGGPLLCRGWAWGLVTEVSSQMASGSAGFSFVKNKVTEAWSNVLVLDFLKQVRVGHASFT